MSFFLLLNIKIILKNLLIFILVLNTKEDILKNVGNQTAGLVTQTDFHFLFSYYQSQCGPATVWLPTFFKISYFVFSTRIKINTGLVQHDWVNDDRI